MFWSSFGNSISQVIVLAVFVVLANFIVPESFGLFAMAGAVLTLLEIFGACGLAEALVQREQLEQEHLSSAFWLSFVLVLIFGGALLLLSGRIAGFFGEPMLGTLLIALSPRLLFLAMSHVQEGVMIRAFRFDELAQASLVGAVVGGLLAVLSAILGAGIWSLVIQDLTRVGLKNLYIWVVAGLPPTKRPTVRHAKELLDYSRHVVGNHLAAVFSFRLSYLLIGYFLGSGDAGLFMLGNRIVVGVSTILGSVSRKVALPLFSRIQSDLRALKKAFLRISGLLAMTTLPIFLGGLVSAENYIPVLFGAEWIPALSVVRLFMLIGVIRVFNHLAGSAFSASGKPNWTMRISVLNGVVDLLVILASVRFGLVVVVAASVLRAWGLVPIQWRLLRKLLGLEVLNYLGQIRGPLTASVALIVTGWMLNYLLHQKLGHFSLLIAQISVCALVYAAVIGLLQPVLYREVRTFWELLLGRKTIR